VPTLRRAFSIYTDGGGLVSSPAVPPGLHLEIRELRPLVVPGPHDTLFGPEATAFSRFQPRRGYVLAFQQVVSGPAGRFFDQTRAMLLEVVRGLEGIGLDVLRLCPFSLALAEERLPEEHLAEDLFSMSFTETGEHGLRAETLGLAHLGQAELSFAFSGAELQEEAGLMCGHLTDWLLDHGRRVAAGDRMAFGFDHLEFRAGAGPALGRGWHHPLITRLLSPAEFPGVGVLEVRSGPDGSRDLDADLTASLRRSLEQRLLLEEYDLTGDAPHAGTTASVFGAVRELKGVAAWREEPSLFRDSGWRFLQRGSTVLRPEVVPLADLARAAPELVRCLALPAGVHLEWDAQGLLAVDASRVRVELAAGEAEP
jgi:hypothetical protein